MVEALPAPSVTGMPQPVLSSRPLEPVTQEHRPSSALIGRTTERHLLHEKLHDLWRRETGSVVIIEDVFRIPGIGSLVLVGIINRDYPVLLAAAMVITLIVLLTNLLVDLMATIIDPRQVRVQG